MQGRGAEVTQFCIHIIHPINHIKQPVAVGDIIVHQAIEGGGAGKLVALLFHAEDIAIGIIRETAYAEVHSGTLVEYRRSAAAAHVLVEVGPREPVGHIIGIVLLAPLLVAFTFPQDPADIAIVLVADIRIKLPVYTQPVVVIRRFKTSIASRGGPNELSLFSINAVYAQ